MFRDFDESGESSDSLLIYIVPMVSTNVHIPWLMGIRSSIIEMESDPFTGKKAKIQMIKFKIGSYYHDEGWDVVAEYLAFRTKFK